VEPVGQSSMTAEQQACEEHFHIHNPTARWKICGQTSKMEPNQLETSRERRLHTIELKLEQHPELKFQYHNFMRKYELGHRDPVNSQEGKKTCYCLPHPVFEEKGSTTRTWITFGGGAKPSNGTQHN